MMINTTKEYATNAADSIRKHRWEYLLERRYPYTLLPRFIDLALSYTEDVPIEEYLQSHFLEAVKASLRYDAQQHEKRGIHVEDLNLKILFDEKTPWMSGFVTEIACCIRKSSSCRWRLKKVVKNQQELESLCLEHIYRRIPHFDPTRSNSKGFCSFERFLRRFVAGYVGNDLRKEYERNRLQISLDVPLQDNPEITLLETIASEDDSFEIEEIPTKILTQEGVLATLENLLRNSCDWDIFYELTYGVKTCTQIASVQRVNPCKISRKMNAIQKNLRQSHRAAAPIDRHKKPRLENFAKHFSSAIDRDSFLERIPRPTFKQEEDCVTISKG
ncbi:MAG: hypothetical protein ACOY3I_10565 [Verrucomicrobiota bacterium]